MSKYQGNDVTVVRDAKAGDPGFDAAKEQSVIRNQNGTEQTVPKSDVTPN